MLRLPKSAALISFGVCATCGATAAGAQAVRPIEFEVTGEFQTGLLDEISGVAVSRTQPGVLWVHNDSGHLPRLYATNLTGAILGGFRVRGAGAIDWEDIALGPCPEQGDDTNCLYIADTGDNDGRRLSGTIYVVPEPKSPAELTYVETLTARAHALRVRYPDGPHDIEALAVTKEGSVLLVTKGRRGPILLYSIQFDDVRGPVVNAELVDTLPIKPARSFGNLVTAAAVSPSGQLLVVRTYTELHFFRPGANGKWMALGSPCWIGLRQPQGEAVDFLDETSLVLASESAMGQRSGLARAICPIDDGVGGIP